jgi:hypothetical protein
MLRGISRPVAPEPTTSGGLRVQTLRVRSELPHMCFAGPSFEHTEQRPLDMAALPLRGKNERCQQDPRVCACSDAKGERRVDSGPPGAGTPLAMRRPSAVGIMPAVSAPVSPFAAVGRWRAERHRGPRGSDVSVCRGRSGRARRPGRACRRTSSGSRTCGRQALHRAYQRAETWRTPKSPEPPA